MYSLRRASLRLLCSPLSSSLATVSRSRCAALPQFTSTRLPAPNAYCSALQLRWNSYSRNDFPSAAEHPDDQASDPLAEEDELDEFRPAQGKRSARHGMMKAVDQPNPPSETVYIGNLFFDLTAEDLREHMEKFGTVLKALIVHDNRGLSKGFGYVSFNTVEDASRAIEEQHLQNLEGRRAVVQYARSHIESRTPKSVPTNTLFLGNIPFEFTDRDVQDLFRDVQDVVDIRIPVDRRSGMLRGFAHAEFISIQAARTAKEVLELQTPYGRKLRVNYAKRKNVGLMNNENDQKRREYLQSKVAENEAAQDQEPEHEQEQEQELEQKQEVPEGAEEEKRV